MPKRQSEGSTERDLKDAENAMVAAGDPALALAMHRHTEAIRNYMMITLVPSFEKAIGSLLDKKLGEVTRRIDASDKARNLRNATFQEHIDDRFDAFGGELTTAIGLVQKVQVSQSAFQASVERHDAELEAIRKRLTALEARGDGQ